MRKWPLFYFSLCLIFSVNIEISSACFGGGFFNYPYGYPNAQMYPPQQQNGSGKGNNSSGQPPAWPPMYPTTGIAGAFDNLGAGIANSGTLLGS